MDPGWAQRAAKTLIEMPHDRPPDGIGYKRSLPDDQKAFPTALKANFQLIGGAGGVSISFHLAQSPASRIR